MNLVFALASALLLQPVLDDDATIRLAASDTHGADVNWYVDEVLVASIPGGQAIEVELTAGPHEVWATTQYEGTWRALARTGAVPGHDVISYVPSWSAVHEADTKSDVNWLAISLIMAGSAAVAVPRFRPKRP